MENEQAVIDAGKRVQAFLDDEAVREAKARLEAAYFADFRRATTAEAREALHARTVALDDLFTTALGTVVESGKMAQHSRNVREAVESRSRTPRGRAV